MKEFEDNPRMSRLGTSDEGVAEYGEGVAIREGVGLKEAGTRDVVEEELVDEEGVISRLILWKGLTLTNESRCHGLPAMD